MLSWLFRSRKAAASRPSVALALGLHRAGQMADAESVYRAVLAEEPDNIDAAHFLGVLAYQLGRYEEAEARIGQVLARNPANAVALNNLGNALAAQGKLDAAMASYREALALQPAYADALVNLGAGCMARGDAEQAIMHYTQALAVDPGNATAHSNLGNAQRHVGRFEQALACHRQAIALDPGMPQAQLNLGNALRDLGRLDEAAECYRKALALRPEFAEAQTNLGNALDELGQGEEAIRHHRTALALRPEFAEAHCNLGNAFAASGRLPEAQACFEQALRHQPGLATASLGLAHLHLLRGDFESGLPLYESRFLEGALSRRYAGLRARAAEFAGVAAWRGEDLSGRTLVVWSEQGLGDCIMASRFLPLLKSRGVGRLLVFCEPALVRVVQGVAGVDEVISRSETVPVARAQLHCPVMSLPLRFATRLATIPATVPYLSVPDGFERAWQEKLAEIPGPKVGLVWAGGAGNPRNALRSLRLAQLDPLLAVAGVNFVNLQKGAAAGELRTGAHPLLDWMADCGDLMDTAALIRQLDLVICVDTSVAHLAGALGAPVWMLNRFESEWRWQLQGEDSPWYPTMRIFRQARPGAWDEVILRVAAELRRQFVAERSDG